MGKDDKSIQMLGKSLIIFERYRVLFLFHFLLVKWISHPEKPPMKIFGVRRVIEKSELNLSLPFWYMYTCIVGMYMGCHINGNIANYEVYMTGTMRAPFCQGCISSFKTKVKTIPNRIVDIVKCWFLANNSLFIYYYIILYYIF